MINYIHIGEPVHQWDDNDCWDYIILDDEVVEQVSEVYFQSGAGDKVVVMPVEFKAEIGKYIVSVPQTLMQSDWDIVGWFYYNNGKKYTFTVPVISRNKPDDYRPNAYGDLDLKDSPTIEKKIKKLTDKLMGRYILPNPTDMSYKFAVNLDMTDGFEYGTYQLIKELNAWTANNYKFNTVFFKDYKQWNNGSSGIAYKIVQSHHSKPEIKISNEDIIFEPYYVVAGGGASDRYGAERLGNGENWRIYYYETEIIFATDLNTLPEPYKTNITKLGVYLHTTKSGTEGNVIDELHIRTITLQSIHPSALPSNVVFGKDIDKTLTVDSKPADAKTVGDRLKAIEDRLAALEK